MASHPPAPPVPLSQVGRAAHDLGLAGLLGGNLFGRLALHPSVTEISDRGERGKVVNAAWRRYGDRQLALAAGGGRRLGRRARRGGAARAALGAASGGSRSPRTCSSASSPRRGLATAAQGVRFARQAPGGAVPLADGDHTAAGASDAQRRAKRRLNVLGLVSLGAEAGLVGVNAALGPGGLPAPPRARAARCSGADVAAADHHDPGDEEERRVGGQQQARRHLAERVVVAAGPATSLEAPLGNHFCDEVARSRG